MFHGSWAPSLISSTNWISRAWSRPPSKQSFRSSLPSRPARLFILLQLHVATRPPLHRQAQHPGIPANPSLRPPQPSGPSVNLGAGMPAGPQAWRHWIGTPQNAKPYCATQQGKLHLRFLGQSATRTTAINQSKKSLSAMLPRLGGNRTQGEPPGAYIPRTRTRAPAIRIPS